MRTTTREWPRISVVVTNHNYERYLPAALASAWEQTRGPHEVVVVDDGSTDGSRALLQAQSRILVVLQAARGQTAAMNHGTRRCSGDVVLFLDADDLLVPETLAQVADAFRDGGVAAVHWALVEVDAMGRPRGRSRPPGPMPEGDLLDRLVRLGPASYEPPPTSGNAWSRSFLDAVMPLPEIETELATGSGHADVFLADLAPLHGEVRVLPRHGGFYRVHGQNDFADRSEAVSFARDSWLYGRRCERLRAALEARGHRPDVAAWRARSWVHGVAAVADALQQLTPAGPVVLVDEAQLPQLFDAHQVLRFPEVDGVYAGPPVDAATAIAGLEELRARGASGVVVAWPAFWWLSYYDGLLDHLQSRWRPVSIGTRAAVFVREHLSDDDG